MSTPTPNSCSPLTLTEPDDESFVNLALVTDGYARTLSIEPNTAHRTELAKAASEARAAGAGLWATCPPES